MDNRYYIELEKYRSRFRAGEDSSMLMEDMKEYYNIPDTLDKEFKKQNTDLVNLYLKISQSR